MQPKSLNAARPFPNTQLMERSLLLVVRAARSLSAVNAIALLSTAKRPNSNCNLDVVSIVNLLELF
jgi:hypothetical protein